MLHLGKENIQRKASKSVEKSLKASKGVGFLIHHENASADPFPPRPLALALAESSLPLKSEFQTKHLCFCCALRPQSIHTQNLPRLPNYQSNYQLCRAALAPLPPPPKRSLAAALVRDIHCIHAHTTESPCMRAGPHLPVSTISPEPEAICLFLGVFFGQIPRTEKPFISGSPDASWAPQRGPADESCPAALNPALMPQ